MQQVQKESILISASGRDQPGIVDRVSGAIFDAGANLEDSRMAILGGEFALFVLVGGTTEQLAAGTSLLMLLIFTAACAALLAIKARREPVAEGVRTYPAIIPALGCLICAALFLARLLT